MECLTWIISMTLVVFLSDFYRNTAPPHPPFKSGYIALKTVNIKMVGPFFFFNKFKSLLKLIIGYLKTHGGLGAANIRVFDCSWTRYTEVLILYNPSVLFSCLLLIFFLLFYIMAILCYLRHIFHSTIHKGQPRTRYLIKLLSDIQVAL